MIYFDTNVYLYAFLENIDDENQQKKSIEYLEKALQAENLLTSEIILYEYAFVAKKLNENPTQIDQNLNFLTNFIQPSHDIYTRVLDILSQKNFYKNSFDVFHLAFAEKNGCDSFVTFDKGFKKLQDMTNMEIIIL